MRRRASLCRFWSREAPKGTGGEGDPDVLGRRVRRIALILIGGGFLFCLFIGGWSWALGYGIGGGIGVAHLELVRHAVSRVLPPQPKKTLWRLVSSSLLRLLGVAIVLFLVVKFLPVSVISLALGLLVGPAAIVGSAYPSRDDLEGGN